MPCRFASMLCAGLLLGGTPVASFAQDSAYQPSSQNFSSDPPAHIAVVDGTAVLERDGRSDTSPSNMPLLAGDRVRTQAGRVGILFADGSTLDLDTDTTVDFQSDDLVRLLDGRVRLSIPGPNRGVAYRIDAPSATAEINQPGDYRLAILRGDREPEVELAVLRGSAELVNDAGRTLLRAGQRAYSRADAAPSYAYAFNSASWDEFDRWSEDRRDQRIAVSTQYLPDEVRPYAPSFDRYGSWRYDTSYGYVWAPTVSVGWRPYNNGRWVTLRPYGWTWVGADPWDWPTGHYGRWGMSSAGWFWIPGRTWGPAWVSWAYAPGYVSWCPLGWDNRPVAQIVNLNAYGRGYDPWRAWTAVPQRRFGGDYNVRRVMTTQFDERTRGAFVPRGSAPEIRGEAVPRAAAPIRIAGTAGGRRVNSPVYTNLEPGASRVGHAPSRTMVGSPRSSVADPYRADRSSIAAERPRAVPREQPGATREQPGTTSYGTRGSANSGYTIGGYSAPAGGETRSRSGGVAVVPAPGRVDTGSSPRAYDLYTPNRRMPPPASQPREAQPQEGRSYNRTPADPYRGNYGVAERPVSGTVLPTAPSGVPATRSPGGIPDRRAVERPPSQDRPGDGSRAAPRAEPDGGHRAPESRERSGAERRKGKG